MLYLFDVDGTLRRPLLLPPLGSLAAWDQHILAGRLNRLEELAQAGHRLGAASNQGIVAFGLVSEARAEGSLAETNRRLRGLLEWIRMCPHHPTGLIPRYRRRCSCRKPAPGLLLLALDHFRLPASEAVYVGDRHTDQEAASAAGYGFVSAEAFFQR